MSKQSKQYESMRQTQANTFSDGLNMDLHPLTTPNTILTDCVNGTMITYNDNEFVLQNERGNTKIDDAKLSEGFIPVGMKEHNGILYIVSHNPQTKESEIGTYPSPKQITKYNPSEFTKELETNEYSNYTDYKKDIIWYDYKLSVSNYDKYKIRVNNPNPLIVLDHYILDKQGNTIKIKLNPINEDESNSYRFTHVGEGILGYKYRPYFLSSISVNIDPVKGARSSQLVISITSDDENLWNNVEISDTETHRQVDEFTIDYDISVELLSSTESLSIPKETIIRNTNINDWNYTYNLTRTDVINLLSLQTFKIDDVEYKYDFREEVVVKMEDGSPTDVKYDKIKFIITPKISKDSFTVIMDHLKTEVISDVTNIFTQESWFSKFQYYESVDQSDSTGDEIFIDFDIELDLEAYDIKYESYSDSNKGEAAYKLHEIDENGNLKGMQVTNAKVFSSSKMWDVVSAGEAFNGKHDLLIDENKILNYLKSDVIMPVQDVTSTDQCVALTSNNAPKYVKYIKENDEIYNIVLYDKDRKIVSTTNIFSTLNGSQCGNDMEEYFTPGYLNYSTNRVKVQKNKIYLFELTFNVFNISENKWKRENASFIVVTADYMLNITEKPARMDEIQLSDWFGAPYDITNINNREPYTWTLTFPMKFKNNYINLSELDSKSIEETSSYARKFFLKYNPLFPDVSAEWIPSIYQRINSEFLVENNSAFDCKVNITGFNESDIKINETIKYEKHFDKKITLIGDAKEYQQTVERKYLYDLFKNDIWELNVISSDAYNIGGSPLTWAKNGGIIKLVSPEGYYLVNQPSVGITDFTNYLTNKSLCVSTKHYIKKRKGNCGLTSGGDTLNVYSSWFEKPYAVKEKYSVDKFNITSYLMHSVGQTNGMNFSKIIETGDHVEYSSTNKYKIWIHSKQNNIYYLTGIDALVKNATSSKLVYDAILKHAYYLNDVNKTVYQYSYESENIKNDSGEIIGSQIKITEDEPTISDITGYIFPMQCIFINKDYSSHNIQSYNNLNYNNLHNINKSIYTGENTISFDEFDEKYFIFLRELGNCLNEHSISKDILNQYNNSSLYFDYDRSLFDEDSWAHILFDNETDIDIFGQNFFILLDNINNPHLKYDKENRILYTDEIKEDKINQFEYTGGDCVAPLKWNYSLTFDEFWNDAEMNSINNLNKYYSLLFYRYSSYADE